MPVGQLKLSVGVPGNADLLGIEGLFNQGLRPVRRVGRWVFEMHSSDWSNGIRYHVFDTRSDSEFKNLTGESVHTVEFLPV